MATIISLLDDPFFPANDEADDFKNKISHEEPARDQSKREEYSMIIFWSYLKGKNWKKSLHPNKNRTEQIKRVRIKEIKVILNPALRKMQKNPEIQWKSKVHIERMTVSRKPFFFC